MEKIHPVESAEDTKFNKEQKTDEFLENSSKKLLKEAGTEVNWINCQTGGKNLPISYLSHDLLWTEKDTKDILKSNGLYNI